MVQGGQIRKKYPSDLTDEQWVSLAELNGGNFRGIIWRIAVSARLFRMTFWEADHPALIEISSMPSHNSPGERAVSSGILSRRVRH